MSQENRCCEHKWNSHCSCCMNECSTCQREEVSLKPSLPDEITFTRHGEHELEGYEAMTDEQWAACWRSLVEHFDNWVIKNLRYKENDHDE